MRKFTAKRAIALSLVGFSTCLFLGSNLKALARNFNPSSIQENIVNEPSFLIAQQSRTQRIRFARGSNSRTVQSAVVRGTRDTYLLSARAGQTMNVSISSVENNAVFDVVAPNGRTLKTETTSFTGSLRAAGDYKIVIGGTRGNATYTLQVSIK